MVPPVSVTLPARLENLPPIMEQIEGCASEAGLSRERLLRLELALEEALVNICRYAYGTGTGEVQVSCRTTDRGEFLVEIGDWGVPFNSLAARDPDVELGIEEREIGGLGLLLMKRSVDRIEYEREGARNVLRLGQRISDPGP